MRAASHTGPTRASGAVEIEEDVRFQARMWRMERIGWWSIAAILAAAAVGVFGHGPYSRATLPVAAPVEGDTGMILDYERFGRAFSASQFVLTRSAPDTGTCSLWLSRDYLKDVEVLRITPDPATQQVERDGVRYGFSLRDGPQTVTFRFKPQRPGILTGAFRLNDGPPTTFQQWLFP